MPRRLRIAVLLAAGLEVRCWLLMRLIRTGLFDMAFTKYIKRMARTRHSSPPVARGRAHDAFNCARSEQGGPNRWTSKSSGQASCLSRDHSHASLVHHGKSPPRTKRREFWHSAAGFVARRRRLGRDRAARRSQLCRTYVNASLRPVGGCPARSVEHHGDHSGRRRGGRREEASPRRRRRRLHLAHPADLV